MNEKGIIQELEIFLKELRDYYSYRNEMKRRTFTSQELEQVGNLRRMLVRKFGKHKKLIVEITGKENVTIVFSNKEYVTDIWSVGLLANPIIRTPIALGYCIDSVIETIGRLEDDINHGKRDPETGEIIALKQPSKSEIDLSNWTAIFDAMQFHPRVIQVSESLFKTGNYASAIFEAFKAVDNYVKEKTGISLNGQALMSKVFDENAPIIKLNDLLTQSDRDEQEGFKFLFKGAMIGIRNPKAHDNVVQTDPYRTLEYLSLASLLMRRIEEGKLVKLLNQRSKKP